MASLVDRIQPVWATTPWLHWAVAYALPITFFGSLKIQALPALMSMYADLSERTISTQALGMWMALWEDVVTTTLVISSILLVEFVGRSMAVLMVRVYGQQIEPALNIISQLLHVISVFALTELWFLPFAADMLLVRARELRFSTDLLTVYMREHTHSASFEISEVEQRMVKNTAIATAAATVVFTVVYTVFVDLSQLPVAPLAWLDGSSLTVNAHVKPVDTLRLLHDEEAIKPNLIQGKGAHTEASETRTATGDVTTSKRKGTKRHGRERVAVAMFAVCFTVAARSTICSMNPAVSAIALNASLNEVIKGMFNSAFQPSAVEEKLTSAVDYLHSDTEEYKLFKDDALFRRTTGFKGPLAFDVAVDQTNLPNVLVIAVESFRSLDSLYLAGNTSAGVILKAHGLTLTPHFDRWAKRGVAFSNMWSSWQTSRSLESILFGQIPLDSASTSGTTGGRTDTNLVGLPQFFKQKGYETAFATGSDVSYDQWDMFLPRHGFDSVLGEATFKRLAEAHLGIKSSDWTGREQRSFDWGVHDDLVFDILAQLISTKVKTQEEYMTTKGHPRHPFFMAHYTISSHVPYESYPAWFDKQSLPDFSPLCQGQTECSLIKKYAKLRYFSDLALGKFLDKLHHNGLLKNMVVVVVGDHGQSPENGQSMPYVSQSDTTHVAAALIAEGRLGDSAGKVIHDATEHYDLLNTLADIVGVPEEGFLQTGVGRSLKRDAPFGERIVWSNNPLKKMSAIRGHKRFVYDRLSNAMSLYDTITDPAEQNDMLQQQSEAKQAEWRAIRTAGRKLNEYFKDRWAGKCLAQATCHKPKRHV